MNNSDRNLNDYQEQYNLLQEDEKKDKKRRAIIILLLIAIIMCVCVLGSYTYYKYRGGLLQNNLNIDTDGDGIPDLNIDLNNDGVCDVNCDTDGDGNPDVNLDYNGNRKAIFNLDTNGDGKPDKNLMNQDTNGDGICDLNCDTNGDGVPDKNIDTNGDGICDVNCDDDPIIDVDPSDNAILYVTYVKAVEALGIEPGWTDTQKFTIENQSNETLIFNINWKDVTNTFTMPGGFTYTIKRDGLVEGTYDAPKTDSKIVERIIIPAKTTYSYEIIYNFNNLDQNQDEDQGKQFSAKIVAEIVQ